MRNLLLVIVLSTFCFSAFSQAISEWRGIGRTGKYTEEKSLLKEWPEQGPELLWYIEDAPKGYSSVAIAHNKIYATGIEEGSDVLLAYSMSGELLWKTAYGRAWDSSYENTRSTPTVTKNYVYVSSGLGDVACLDAKNGEMVWGHKTSDDNNGAAGRFGYSESLLVYGDHVFFTPAGNSTTTVAYDRKSGKEIWKTSSLKDAASYSSPLLLEHKKRKLLVNFTENFFYAIDIKNGDILWEYNFGKYKQKRNNQTNTPLFFNNELFLTSGYNHKSSMLKLSEDLLSYQEKWTDSILDVHFGGVVNVDGFIYGANWTNNSNGNWCCIEWETGKCMYEEKWNNKGNIIYADGMLYIYDEKRGNFGLVKPNPEKFELISSFKVPYGRGPHWAHPVIKDGVLYIRHENAIMAYNIKQK